MEKAPHGGGAETKRRGIWLKEELGAQFKKGRYWILSNEVKANQNQRVFSLFTCLLISLEITGINY